MNAQKILAVSQYTKDKILRSKIKCDIKVINPGVNKKIYKPSNKYIKEKNIVFVGNEKKRKGLYYLLRACLEINPLLLDELLLIVKFKLQDSLIKNLINQIQSNGIRIRILTNISNFELVRNYQKSKINILPSQNVNDNFEGFGLIHLEANACGTLTIGCCKSGNEDAIKEGYGFLVPQKSHKELVQKK